MFSQPHPRPLAVLVLALALVVPLGVMAGADGSAADLDPVTTPAPTADSGETTVTLITGDRVTLTAGAGADSQPEVHVTDPFGEPASGYGVHRAEDGVYVIPHGVTGLVPEVLDEDLFNVTRLVEMGYDDESSDVLPLVVQTGSTPGGLAATTPLETRAELTSIDAVAAHLDKDDAGDLGAALSGLTPGSDRALTSALGGGTRVWLDGKVEVAALDGYLEQVNAPPAWELGLDGSGTTVAVLDTGVDTDHPALAGQVTAERNFTDEPDAADRQGHGTHVASLLAGTGAGSGGARQGIAPAAEVLSAKVLDNEGAGQQSWVIAGLEWAVSEGADIANLSLAGQAGGEDDPLVLALEALAEDTDTLFVVAAGNFGHPTQGQHSIGTPGTAPSALTVGAVRDDDLLASFSSWGPTRGSYRLKPDLVAPGVDLLGARAGAPEGNLYTPMSGTSMAAPVVAGAAALVRQQHPEWDAEQVKARLMTTADPNGWWTAWTHGAGRLDLAAATDRELSSDRANLDFGYVYYPDEEDRQATVTLTNEGTEDATVDLSASLSDSLRVEAPEGAITVEPASVTVPAGGSAEVEVVVDLQVLEHEEWQGVLSVASGSAELLRIPVGLYFEPPTHVVDLDVLDRNGDPWDPAAGDGVPGADPTIPIFNGVTGGFIRLHPDSEGRVSARVPEGEWMVLARVFTPGADGLPGTVTVTGTAGLNVHEDTSVVLDAREGERLDSATISGQEAEARHGMHLIYNRRGDSQGYGEILPLDSQMVADGRVFLTPTEPVQAGTFEAVTRWWLEPTGTVPHDAPDAYDLVFTRDSLSADLGPDLDPDDVAALARVAQRFHPVGGPGPYAVTSVASPGDVLVRIGLTTEVQAPGEREVQTFTGGDASWEECLHAPANANYGLCSPARQLDPGEELTRPFGTTMHPLVRSSRHSLESLYASVGVTDGLHAGSLDLGAVQKSVLHLETADGTPVGSADGTYAYFPTGDLEGRFRLSHDLKMTPGALSSMSSARTVWEFDSAPPGPGGGYSTAPTLLGIDYGVDLDPSGRVRADRALPLRLDVAPTTGGDGTRIQTAQLTWSTDDGASWHDLRVRRTGDHTFHALLPASALRGADALSFRVVATDAAGNSVDQTTHRLLSVQ